MALLSFACLMARSTEFWMPLPSAARSPESGAMTPILATLLLPLSELVPESLERDPQPVRASDATTSELPIITTER